MKINVNAPSFRILATMLLLPIAACRYEEINQEYIDAVDFVIAGDAKAAADGFSFPLTHNEFEPLLQIHDKADFIRLFPVMFDRGVREELQRMKAEGGWSFSNYMGEAYGDGAFWRIDRGDDFKINIVNITGKAFYEYYQKLYAQETMNLAPEYRNGLAWVYAYFAAEDDTFYGRVDALGTDERKTSGRTADRWRIMIWNKDQRPNEKPRDVFFCHGLHDGGSLSDGSIDSEDGRIKFQISYFGTEDSPWGWLEDAQNKTNGSDGLIRLKRDTPWLEKYPKVTKP